MTMGGKEVKMGAGRTSSKVITGGTEKTGGLPGGHRGAREEGPVGTAGTSAVSPWSERKPQASCSLWAGGRERGCWGLGANVWFHQEQGAAILPLQVPTKHTAPILTPASVISHLNFIVQCLLTHFGIYSPFTLCI